MTLSEEIRKYRIIDLTQKIVPGQAKGPLDTGRRIMEITPFHYPPGELMHRIQMESHIGTHVETPLHWVSVRYKRDGMDVSQIPADAFIGDTVLLDLSAFTKRQAILPKDFQTAGVKAGHIVVIGNSSYTGQDRPYFSYDAAEWLAGSGVKVVGIDNTVYPEDPKVGTKNLELYHTHDFLLSNDIPLIEGLINLDKIGKKQFFLIGTVVPIAGLEAFPVRVLAFV
jgi:arylformamidase